MKHTSIFLPLLLVTSYMLPMAETTPLLVGNSQWSIPLYPYILCLGCAALVLSTATVVSKGTFRTKTSPTKAEQIVHNLQKVSRRRQRAENRRYKMRR